MVDGLNELKHWAKQITARPTVSPGEQLQVAEAAIAAGLMVAIDVLLDVRGQKADDEAMTRLVMLHLMPTMKNVTATSLDAVLGPADVDPSIFDEHYDG